MLIKIGDEAGSSTNFICTYRWGASLCKAALEVIQVRVGAFRWGAAKWSGLLNAVLPARG